MCATAIVSLLALGGGLYQGKRAQDAAADFKRPPVIDQAAQQERIAARRRAARGAAMGGFGTAATNRTGAAGIPGAGLLPAKGAKMLLGA